MKICVSFLSFGTDIFAGIENSIYNLCLGFKAHQADVFVYSSYLSGAESNINSIRVFRSQLLPRSLPKGNIHGDLAISYNLIENSFKIQQEFYTLIKEETPNCVITCDPLWGIIQVSGAWRNAACPIVLSLHVLNTKDLLEEASRIPFLFRRTVSHVLKEQIRKVYPLKDLVVIPNSIDTTHFKPLNNTGYDSKVIFCNARINPDKGIPYLIRAFARFSKDFPEFELWLCDGEFPFGDKHIALKQVHKEIHELGISRQVNFLPNLPWRHIPNIIRRSFAVVLPTLYESFGRAALETLACGVPLIASKVGNLPELAGKASILVDPQDSQQIYEGLTYLHENKNNYDILAREGPKVAARYDNSLIARHFLDIIREKSGASN